jgi:exonuclease III
MLCPPAMLTVSKYLPASSMIFYQNVRGLRTRVDELYLSSVENNYDIIALTETWLHAGIMSTELFVSRYSIYRHDREISRGGGVLIAVNKRVPAARVPDHEINTLLTIQSLYRPDLIPTSRIIPDFISTYRKIPA